MEVVVFWLRENWYVIAGVLTLFVILLFFYWWRDKLKESWNKIARNNNFKVKKNKSHPDYKILNKMMLTGEIDGIKFDIFAVEKDSKKPFEGIGSTVLEMNVKNHSLIIMINGILNKTLDEIGAKIQFNSEEKDEKTQDAALGGPDFNRHFLVQTNTLINCRRVLDSETQQMLLSHLIEGFVPEERFLIVRLKGGKLTLKKSTVISVESEILKMLELGATIARKTRIE